MKIQPLDITSLLSHSNLNDYHKNSIVSIAVESDGDLIAISSRVKRMHNEMIDQMDSDSDSAYIKEIKRLNDFRINLRILENMIRDNNNKDVKLYASKRGSI